jgi:hypothetical protein
MYLVAALFALYFAIPALQQNFSWI